MGHLQRHQRGHRRADQVPGVAGGPACLPAFRACVRAGLLTRSDAREPPTPPSPIAPPLPPPLSAGRHQAPLRPAHLLRRAHRDRGAGGAGEHPKGKLAIPALLARLLALSPPLFIWRQSAGGAGEGLENTHNARLACLLAAFRSLAFSPLFRACVLTSSPARAALLTARPPAHTRGRVRPPPPPASHTRHPTHPPLCADWGGRARAGWACRGQPLRAACG